eukprot:9362938-Pyramimonas_sp.AAC.1
MGVTQKLAGHLGEVWVCIPTLAAQHLPQLGVELARRPASAPDHLARLAVQREPSALEGMLALVRPIRALTVLHLLA